MGNTLKPSIKFLSTPRGNDVPPRGWNGGSSNREKQGRCSKRPGETGRGRGDIVAVVAVGREGVVCRGRGVDGRRVALSVLLLVWNPYRKGSNFPSGLSLFSSRGCSYVRLTMRDATTPDVCASFLFSPFLRRSRPLKRTYVTTQSNAVAVPCTYRGHDAPGTLVDVHQHFPFSPVVRCSVKGLKAWEGRCSRHEGKARAQRVQ